jgi:hypothetical protein
MLDLTLKAGGRLVAARWNYDEATETGTTELFDVSDNAASYLFDQVDVEDGVTLGDVFRVLAADPALQSIYKRSFAESLCAEAAKGAEPWPDENPAHELEYLELYHVLEFNSAEASYGPLDRWSMHGIGVELSEDYPLMGKGAGERIEWSIHMTPVRQLLALPLRLKNLTMVIETDRNTTRRRRAIKEVLAPHITLGQLLHQVLHELSWYGTPEEQAQLGQELAEKITKRDDRSADSANEDPFESLNQPPVAKMFESIGEYTCRQVFFELQGLEDTVNAAQGLTKAFGAEVVVKPEYRELTAYDFRKEYRLAKMAGAKAARRARRQAKQG